jgi:hypothetical protein
MLPLIVLSFACVTRPVSPIAALPVSEQAPELVDVTPAPPLRSLPTLQSYELRRGETLEHFARWSGLPAQSIADASALSLEQDQLPAGTIVRLPLDADGVVRLAAAREEHHTRRAQQWVRSRGGEVGTAFHRVRSGQTARDIVQQYGELPMWVIETYNPEVDLQGLRPGQQLLLPLLADAVVPEGPEGH